MKKRYNELKARFEKGTEYLTAHPEETEKYEKELEEMQNELSEIIDTLKMTQDQIENGFSVEEIEEENKNNKPEILNPENKVVALQQQPSNTMVEFKENFQIASQLAKSDLVPKNYQNKPANIVIAMSMANKMDLDLFTVMQNLNIVNGSSAWSGSFCKTLVERTGKFTSLDYNYEGTEGKDDFACYVTAVRKTDGKIITGPKITTIMAKGEDWYKNKKWTTMPMNMFSYRAMSYFSRLHCPEALSGIYTEDEIIDIPSEKTVTEIKDILD